MNSDFRQFSFICLAVMTVMLSGIVTATAQTASDVIVSVQRDHPASVARPAFRPFEGISKASLLAGSRSSALAMQPDRVVLNRAALKLPGFRSTAQVNGAKTGQQVAGNGAPVSVMTAGDKLRYGLKRTFLRPQPYLFAAFKATYTQLREEDQPQKDTGDKVADGLSRLAISMASSSTRTFLVSGLYPIIFRADPRYHPSGKQGFGARVWYATSRVFVTEDDSGHLRPNYARLGGSLTASALANFWERNTPGHRRIGVTPTFTRFGSMIGFDVLQFILLKEFGPDIKRKIFGQ